MNETDEATLFRLFWENSKLNRRTIRDFAAGLERDDRSVHETSELAYSQSRPLPAEADRLFTLMARRRSERTFAPTPLSIVELGRLFSAFAHRAGGRLLPSAGGRYPIEVFAFLFAAEGEFDKTIVHYDGSRHSLAIVGQCPDYGAIHEELGLSAESSRPAAMFFFAAFPSRILPRYAERGGRFLLIECGHYAQNLALRLAEDGLCGYELGGYYDDAVRSRLGLADTDAMVALGYACGNDPARR
ncbi:MAG: SagB/ThcOx family dehydrogenase [Polyangiaceae bacterium]|nr:SagB/ThcOx family dehydrogenase [Polyangiaceae bacterium]